VTEAIVPKNLSTTGTPLLYMGCFNETKLRTINHTTSNPAIAGTTIHLLCYMTSIPTQYDSCVAVGSERQMHDFKFKCMNSFSSASIQGSFCISLCVRFPSSLLKKPYRAHLSQLLIAYYLRTPSVARNHS
jgi:hypothetical protein